MKFIVGLTGLIGSGKSMVAHKFQHLGIDIIDTDKIAHDITSHNGIAIAKIRQNFGKNYINMENSLDRPKMRELIFSDQHAKIQLENILHPIILKETHKLIAASKSPYTIIAVPLLFKSLTYMSLIHRSIFVDCNKADLIKRVSARSNLSHTQINAILKSQVPPKIQLSLCDDVLDNNHSLPEMYNNVLKLDNKYRTFCQNII